MRRKRVTLSDVTHHITLKQYFNNYKFPEKKTGVKKILM